MAALIFFRRQDRWMPQVLGLPRDEPNAYAVLAGRDEARETQFSYHGLRFAPEEVRRDFYLHSPHKMLGDVFPVCARWGCSAEFRAEVERLEPGVHQFFPIRITRPRSKKPILRTDGREAGPGDFFLFNCLKIVDAVIPELSSGPILKRYPSGALGFSEVDDDLCVSRAAIAGRHIWHGAHQNRGDAHFFVSDALRELLVARKLQGFVIRPVGEA
jgi:hypothetical protein